jgi:DNA-binding transcriptional LysR family regulator
MENWDDYRYFAALAQTGTLRAAARLVASDQATVGRRVKSLEAALAVKLFEKRSDGYFMTPMGMQVRESIARVQQEFDGIGRQAAGDDQKMEGIIRIAAPGALANHLLIPGLTGFLRKHPRLTLEFITGPEVVNLAKREADVALRLVRPAQRGLRVKRVGEMSLALYGQREALKEHGHPRTREELAKFPFAALQPESMSELESGMIEGIAPFLRKVIVSHAWSSVLAAVQAGTALGILPTFIAERDGLLERLPVLASRSCPIWWVIHPDLRSNRRVKLLMVELEKVCARAQ